MEVKDYSNLISVCIGIAVIVCCVIVYSVAQIYFKGLANQAKKDDKHDGTQQ